MAGTGTNGKAQLNASSVSVKRESTLLYVLEEATEFCIHFLHISQGITAASPFFK